LVDALMPMAENALQRHGLELDDALDKVSDRLHKPGATLESLQRRARSLELTVDELSRDLATLELALEQKEPRAWRVQAGDGGREPVPWRAHAVNAAIGSLAPRLAHWAPNLMVIGPPKTATDWVFRMLMSEPRFYCPGKELRYFSHFWREFPLDACLRQTAMEKLWLLPAGSAPEDFSARDFLDIGRRR